jgi:hypothetical protein
MLRDAGVGRSAFEAGMRPDLGWLPSSREKAVKTNLSRGVKNKCNTVFLCKPSKHPVLFAGWFVKPEFTGWKINKCKI